MKINRENKDVTENELMDKIGVWAKEKGMEVQWAHSTNNHFSLLEAMGSGTRVEAKGKEFAATVNNFDFHSVSSYCDS